MIYNLFSTISFSVYTIIRAILLQSLLYFDIHWPKDLESYLEVDCERVWKFFKVLHRESTSLAKVKHEYQDGELTLIERLLREVKNLRLDSWFQKPCTRS